MAEILEAIPAPHECQLEIWQQIDSVIPEREIWTGSKILCSCGQKYIKVQDENGARWESFE